MKDKIYKLIYESMREWEPDADEESAESFREACQGAANVVDTHVEKLLEEKWHEGWDAGNLQAQG